MSFDAVRQIIESRIFSESYTTVLGDSLTSISSQFNKTGAQIGTLNPGVDLASSLVINFGTNDTNDFNFSRIEGFGNNELGSGFTVLEFRGSSIGPDNSAAGTVSIAGTTKQLNSQVSSTNEALSVKVNDWVNLINGEVTIGFTAIATNDGESILLDPDTGVTITSSSSLTVARNNFQALLGNIAVAGVVVNLGSTLSFPVFLEGREFVQPTATGSNWAVLFINDSAVVGREFGNTNGLRSSGSVRLKLYAPRRGTRLVREMADALDAILSYSAGSTISGGGFAGGTLLMKAGSLKRVSDDADGKLSYNLDYIYDYYTS